MPFQATRKYPGSTIGKNLRGPLQGGNCSTLTYRVDTGVPGYTGFIPSTSALPVDIKGCVGGHAGLCASCIALRTWPTTPTGVPKQQEDAFDKGEVFQTVSHVMHSLPTYTPEKDVPNVSGAWWPRGALDTATTYRATFATSTPTQPPNAAPTAPTAARPAVVPRTHYQLAFGAAPPALAAAAHHPPLHHVRTLVVAFPLFLATTFSPTRHPVLWPMRHRLAATGCGRRPMRPPTDHHSRSLPTHHPSPPPCLQAVRADDIVLMITQDRRPIEQHR